MTPSLSHDMNIIKKLLPFLVLTASLFFYQGIAAQELNCQVEINSDQVQGTNKSVFETLQNAINQKINNNVFSNAQFSPNEKIECRLFFTIKEVNDNTFTGDLQIQSTRPVYNASLMTTVINFKDSKIEFAYQENEPLIFSVNSMESQLTAILNFYAYLILAMDFDTFSPHGGDWYWDRLKEIVQMAQSSGETGWRAFEDTKNRSAVLSAYTDASTSSIRDLYYRYHRTGLDEMATSPDKGRANITKSLENLKSVYDVAPMSVALSMFRDAKLDELVNIYSQAPPEERSKVYDILQPLYPTDQDRLEQIKNGKQKR